MNIRSIANILANRPKTVILIFTLFTLIIGSQATNVYMVSDFSNYLPQDDPTLELWEKINDEFELGSTIIILINQTKSATNTIVNHWVLKEMDELYRMLYEYPKNEGKETGIKKINSLSKLIREENNKPMGVGNGVDDIPDNIDTITTYMQRSTIKSAENVLYTADGKYAAMIVQLEENADYDKVLQNIKDAIEKRGTKYAQISVTGTIALQQAIQKESMNNLVIVFPIAIISVSIVLFIFHRNLKGILIAFIPPAFALALTFGVIGLAVPELT